MGVESYRIRIQEVEVVNSHDLMCNCAGSDTVVSSDDNPWEFDKLHSLQDNPTFALGTLHNPVEVDGDVYCDEWVGMVERNIELRSIHMDVMWGSQPELEPPKWNTTQVRAVMVAENQEHVRGVTVAKNQEKILELEWNTQLDKDIDFSITNLNLREESVHFTTALTYFDSDLVPVSVSIVSALVISEVHAVVTNGVASKVRSINEVTIATGLEEQRGVLIKARGTSQSGKAKTGRVIGGLFANCSLSDLDIQARQQAIRREAEAMLQLGVVVGVETVRREEELISDLSRIISRHRVRDLLRKQHCDMAFLLESKWEVATQLLVVKVWQGDVFDFAFAPSIGASGVFLLFGIVRGFVVIFRVV
ncbi:hypothetical protein GQ457_01G017420 [Hibiscus cannabinus]